MGKMENKNKSFLIDHSGFLAKKTENALKKRKEKIRAVFRLFLRIIFLFLSPLASQAKNKTNIKTLIEARSTPSAGLMAGWNGR